MIQMLADIIQDRSQLLTADRNLYSRESRKVQFTSLFILFIEQSCQVVLFTYIYMQCI